MSLAFGKIYFKDNVKEIFLCVYAFGMKFILRNDLIILKNRRVKFTYKDEIIRVNLDIYEELKTLTSII